MLIEYDGAELHTATGERRAGKAIAWLPSDAEAASAYSRENGLQPPSTPENGPWSGLFIGTGSAMPDSAAAVDFNRGQTRTVMAQASYDLPGRTATYGSTTYGGATYGGQTAERWVVEFTGEGAPPTGLTQHDRASELVGADTVQRWRERALNLVEELARERLESDDSEERFAGELALAAVTALRDYIEPGVAPDRREAWTHVFTAIVDFIPKGREGLNLVKAVRELARAYEIPIP